MTKNKKYVIIYIGIKQIFSKTICSIPDKMIERSETNAEYDQYRMGRQHVYHQNGFHSDSNRKRSKCGISMYLCRKRNRKNRNEENIQQHCFGCVQQSLDVQKDMLRKNYEIIMILLIFKDISLSENAQKGFS